MAVGLQGAFLPIRQVAKPLASELQLVAILADINAVYQAFPNKPVGYSYHCQRVWQDGEHKT